MLFPYLIREAEINSQVSINTITTTDKYLTLNHKYLSTTKNPFDSLKWKPGKFISLVEIANI